MPAVVFEKTESLFFSTSNTDSNTVVSENGSKITISLDNQLSFPAAAVNLSLEVSQAVLWNVSPNISTLYNNNKFSYIIAGVTQPEITVPDGLYSLDTLNDFLSREFVNANQASKLISFTGNISTQRVILTIGQDNVQADFSSADSVGQIMGFTQGLQPSTQENAGFSVESTNEAKFNRVNSYVIKSNLLSGGIPVNNSGLNILASIPIDVKVGSQIVFTPYNPIKVDAGELRGKSKGNFWLQLADQDGGYISTLGETWSVLIVFRYSMLLTDGSVPLLDL